ncbi:hypothetical protein GCM10009850_047230 [Nonomuraea monospora]|uniref:Caspase domain-containing protein n=1 Tax=Nonomuraea monospora TaxID=568818 RepID=A0ABN3CIJ2_9ACTN
MTARHALLIGVPKCDNQDLRNIEGAVRENVRLMQQALEQSGYQVATLGGPDGPEPGVGRIDQTIEEHCKTVPEGGVLLLYFSGHGVTVEGEDYLVPGDASRAGTSAARHLIPLIPDSVRRGKARLVVFFVDACRDRPDEDPVRIELDHGPFVLITGCGPGRQYRYGEEGSLFTQVLAQVLGQRNPARTVLQVFDEVTKKMPGARPPHLFPERSLVRDVEICEGNELALAWRRSVNKAKEKAPQVPDKAWEAVHEVVETCAAHRNSALAELRKSGIEDPWHDQDYPNRILDRVYDLLGDFTDLSPEEVTLLIVAPFLRERLLAEGIHQAAGLHLDDFRRTYDAGPRNDLEITHESYRHVVQRAEGLAARGDEASAHALAMWLVHQWQATRFSLWQGNQTGPVYWEAVTKLKFGPGDVLAERILPLRTFVGGVGAELDGLPPGLGERWRTLTHVLALAGTLAIDVRRLPPVIADHLGTQLELPLSTVLLTAERVQWHRENNSYDLDRRCEHPALHLALQHVAQRGNALLTAAIEDRTLARSLVEKLPGRVTSDELRPAHRDAETLAYKAPVVTFRLAEDKVRDLLMGRQLYDEPSLALRELYQNALDACKWRGVRHAYSGTTDEWTGKIIFRTGEQGGRAYIECVDNGIGMDADILEHVFASAGERFVYQQEFRKEQADWEARTPPLRMVPNSQFGVGVFSYFMLADEMTVVTRRFLRTGVVDPQAYEAHITSSGSVLRITPVEGMRKGGTRVRLYLSGDVDGSVLRALRDVLWVSEYDVDAPEGDVWRAGDLRFQDKAKKCGENLWWVSGKGGLLADGIRTSEDMFGLVVNLRDTRRPQLTVDRKKLRNWDKKWVTAEIDRYLPELEEWEGLTLSWLWQMANQSPEVAEQVFRHLARVDKRIPAGTPWDPNKPVRVGLLGCLPEDERVLLWKGYTRVHWVRVWRAMQWHEATGEMLFRGWDETGPGTSAGHPLVGPVDAALLTRLRILDTGPVVHIEDLIDGLTDQEEGVVDRLRRLRRYAITGLDVSCARDLPPVAGPVKEELGPLLAALLAWSRSGNPPREKASSGFLVRASQELDLPVGEVLRRAAELAPREWVAPDLQLGELAGEVCTSADVVLMSRRLDGRWPWTVDELGPSQVARASQRLDRSLEEVLERCDRLAPFGVRVVGRERYPDAIDNLEREALRHVKEMGRCLTPLELVSIAAKWSLSVLQVYDRLGGLERCRLLKRPDISGLPKDYPLGQDEDEFIDTFLSFYDCGMRYVLPPRAAARRIAGLLGRGSRLSGREQACAGVLAPFATPDEPFTMTDFVYLAATFESGIREAREHLLRTFPGASAEPISGDTISLPPSSHLRSLLSNDYRSQPLQWDLSPGALISAAHDANLTLGAYVRRLRPYLPPGVPLREIRDADLDETRLTEEDTGLLRVHGIEEDTYTSTVDALHLVRTAGKYGRKVTETHHRLLRFAPLGLTLAYPNDACPDDIVHWQDLLALTVHLDGQPPAITGPVTQDHLAKAAWQLEETPAQVRDRLARYARLFALTLPELEGLQ